MRLLPLIVLCACATGGQDTDDEKAEDTGDSAAAKVDTGLALVYYEGSATYDATAWEGEESWVATTVDGATEHCRVTNALSGTPADVELCPGCTFAFEVTVGAGTATGDACPNVGFAAEMWEGARWIYAFAPSYVYGPYGYSYSNVLLYGYDAGDGMRWSITAYAETDDDSRIDYESVYSDLWTYYYL